MRQRFGKGEREVRVNTLTMADEIEILAGHSTKWRKIWHPASGLEQEIRDRRQAGRPSAKRAQVQQC